MTVAIVVLVTENLTQGREIARQVVEERLAACVNLIPAVESTYCWQSAVKHEQEALLIIKTTRDAWEPLCARIKERHTNDMPEIIALPIVAGSADYLAWLHAQIRVA